MIHGTFFPNAEWTQPESVFANRLREHLPGVVIKRFQWSSCNSPSARQTASFELLFHLEEIDQKFPEYDHYLVAHSHGGSVALDCLQEVSLESCVAGLVCMNTPRLEYSSRNFPESSGAMFPLGILAAMAIGAGLGWSAGLATVVGVILAIIAFSPGSKRDAKLRISELANKTPVVPLLWVCNQDQMPKYLTTIATFAALPGWLLEASFATAGVLHLGFLMFVIVLIVPAMAWDFIIGSTPNIWGAQALASFFKEVEFRTVAFVFLLPVAYFILVLANTVRRLLAFGSVGSGDVFLSVRVNREAPTDSRYDRLGVLDSKGFWHSILTFQYSRVYDSPSVVARIALWTISPKPADSGHPTSSVIYD